MPKEKIQNERITVEISIGGETLRISSNESEEYMQGLAYYIENKMNEIMRAKKNLPTNSSYMKTLLPLNIADDLFREIRKNQELEEELERYINEIGKLQQENALLSETVSNLQLELEASRQELNEFIESFSPSKKGK